VRARLRIGLFVILVALLCLAPHLVWRWLPSRTLAVVIVDKTVPFREFREHAAVPWLLHALKIRAPDGRFLDPTHDYLGFDPITKTGNDITAADMASADAVIVTDTYGVYDGDYGQPHDQAALEHSPMIYGGVTDDEARALEVFVAKGGLLIAEFNTFASPTRAEARARLEALFGVHWTGWVGRYWPDLHDSNEVPRWMGRLWEEQTHTPFDLTGAGLVFVREDQSILVLRATEDLLPGVLAQQRTQLGAASGMAETASYRFWFDVVQPVDAEVLCEHVVDVTPAGAAKLRALGLPIRFPAVAKRQSAWYLAGDFVDSSIERGRPELAGLLLWKRYVARVGGVPEERFFWGWYAPLVGSLLEQRAR
jgi:hypothetical protein